MPQTLHLIFQKPQWLIDQIGMYRTVSGGLSILAAISILTGFTGQLAYSGLAQIFSLAVALLVALTLNIIFSLLFKIPANHESAVITALLLFFLTIPEVNIFANWPLALAVAIGIASKFLLTYKKQHFMNPAAFGAVAVGLSGLYEFTWWIATPVLIVPLLIIGLLVVMKVRKWIPVLACIAVSWTLFTVESATFGISLADSAATFFLSWPTLFLAFFMLTEPFTMPARKDAQFFYGGLVGFLAHTSIIGSFIPITPELALVFANIVMIPTRLNHKLFLKLEEKRTIAQNTYEFIFKKPVGLSFLAGQYLEWMLPHQNADSRGIRRYFTIASSPTEPVVRLAFKTAEQGSSYKTALQDLDTGDTLVASQLSGDFILPKNTAQKLGFIAGGIGITPFRSHLEYMQDSGNNFDTVLFYANNEISDIAYQAELAKYTQSLQLTLIPVIAQGETDTSYESGYVTTEIIARRTPDYLERQWYVSGSPQMVDAVTEALFALGVKRNQVKRDFFPGVA